MDGQSCALVDFHAMGLETVISPSTHYEMNKQFYENVSSFVDNLSIQKLEWLLEEKRRK